MERRQFIVATTLTATVGLAGCLSRGEENESNEQSDGEGIGNATTDEDTSSQTAGCSGDGDTSGPENVAKAYLNADSLDKKEDLVHSESRIQFGDGDYGFQPDAMEVACTELIEENLDADGVRETLTDPSTGESYYSDSKIKGLAEQSNAVVEATVTVTDGDGERTFVYEVFTAKEDGNWRAVRFDVPKSS